MATLSNLSALAVAALSLHSVCAAPAPEPKVVTLHIEKRAVSAYESYARLGKRASTYTAPLYSSEGGALYLVNVTIGTPGQSVQLQLDTGSSDIWVPWVNSNLCESSGDLCSTGSFNENKSSSFVDVNPGAFHITYGDGTDVTGDYMNDTFGIAGATVSQMTMGLAKEQQNAPGGSSALFTGLVGVGFDTNEAIYTFSNGTIEYPNIISQLVLQGKINTRAYSLWLNDLDAATGSVLFGGVDTLKYTGDLVVLPLQNDPVSGIISSFTVTFAGMTVTGNSGKTVYSTKSTAAVLLDSGTAITYIPANIAYDIMNGVGAVNDTDYGVIVPCDLASTQGVFNFQFGNLGGPVIAVPISEFVLPISPAPPTFKGGQAACAWGLMPDNGNGNVFGDTFLRSAYLVYNIDGQSVGIAQTKFNSTSSNIEEITATDSIPGATSAVTGAAPASVTAGVNPGSIATASGTANIATATGTSTFDLGTPTSTSNSASNLATATSTSTSKGAAAGLTPPSTPFIGAIAISVTALFAMLGGSMLVFV